MKMKTLLTGAALFFTGAVFSQNNLEFQNHTTSGVVGEVVIEFEDGSREAVYVAGPGMYSFDIGSHEVTSLLFGTTVCEIGVPTTIHLQIGGTAGEIIDPPKRTGKRTDSGEEILEFTSIIR
jgi:hypothetical protein